MSDYRAMAAVTATLRNLLQTGIESVVGGFTVTTRDLDRARTNNTGNQLNLFLYHVVLNSAWRNQEMPRQAPAGDLAQPPLALDLFYLLTAYEADSAEPNVIDHQILGRAMALLHDHPLLGATEIDNALAGTGLQNQFERIRITPQPLSLEEISKLWSGFQTSYRLSVAYQAAVVLIDSRRRSRAGLPVREPRVFVSPIRRPFIEEVVPQLVPPGGTITIRGASFLHNRLQVRIGDSMVTPVNVSDQQLDAVLPAGLPAGVTRAQIVHVAEIDTPASPHPRAGVESNIGVFMLTPAITTVLPVTVAAGTDLTLNVTPPVGRDQRVVLILGDRVIELPARPSGAPLTTSTLVFPIPAGMVSSPTDFVARVQVDGAQSPLVVDTNPASPNFNKYIGPIVTVTP